MRLLKGQPQTFDVEQFQKDLQRIANETANPIFLPVYDRKLHDPVANALRIDPAHRYVIVEGMLLLHDQLGFEKIQELLDICLFIDVPMETCHKRVVDRKALGGRSRDDAEAHYERVDKPNIIRVLETKHRAHILLYVFGNGSSKC